MAEPGNRATLRRRPGTRFRLAAVAIALALVACGARVGVRAWTSDDGGTTARAPSRADAVTAPALATPSSAPPAVAVAASPFRAASTKGGDVPVFGAPDPSGAPTATLSPTTEYLQPRTLLAFEQQRDWLHVYLPTRPNSSTGWVKAGDVDVSAPLEGK